MRRIVAVALVLLALVGTALAVLGRFVLPFRPRVNHQVVMLPRERANLSGLKLAFVSDTHVGPTFSAANLRPIVHALKAERPDILLLGGDYVSQSPYFIDEVAPMIAEMAQSPRYGTFAVLGNHDIANVRSRVEKMVHDAGVTLLDNAATAVETDRGTLWIAGLDDLLLGRPDPEAAFADVPADAACVCLWHEPDAAEQVQPFGPFLMLSGHTHGGQVALPLLGPLALPKAGKRYASGRFIIGDMTLLVSNGVGLYRPPVRLGALPELVIVHLLG